MRLSSSHISIDRPIEEKIQWAKHYYEAQKEALLGDSTLNKLLKDLNEAIYLSHLEMTQSGIDKVCKECDEKDGGSCCGAGLENQYSGVLLLINLLLGQTIPEQRLNPKGCFFLRAQGCSLFARHVICVNYLCKKIIHRIPSNTIVTLREKEGLELETLFITQERIKTMLRTHDAS
jgi:hypothetical protein